MTSDVETHYSGTGNLEDQIRKVLASAGKDIEDLTVADLAAVDEFHVRGREATLELAGRMGLSEGAEVIDIGSGLGGPARTLADKYSCRVTGIDLTECFCQAARAMSDWVGLADRTSFRQGDATALPFDDDSFDAAMTIHVAMNIAAKDAVYAEAKRVLKPGSIFAVYDILQGEGGPVRFPVPWAREPSISHLATPFDMRDLLTGAGFEIVDEIDSTDRGLAWFEEVAARMRDATAPQISFRSFLGPDFGEMAINQVKNLSEKRIRTITFVARA